MTTKMPRIGPDGLRRSAWILFLVVTAIILATAISMSKTACTARPGAEFATVHSVDAKVVGAVAYTASTIDLGTIGRDWDLAAVEQGTNDAGRSTLNIFRNDYEKLLDAIRVNSLLVQLVCLGVCANRGSRSITTASSNPNA
ncbi:MAG: hypothetical protein LLG14_04885 [Nocardiaceae bacterium]|nr:hypothetical protein [Nocardiaceae bacterium]